MKLWNWCFSNIILLCVLSGPASAQLDPDCKFYLVENDRRVGEVFVPTRALGDTEYLEHWVLYPGYAYPGRQYLRGLTIQPAIFEKPYRDLNDFLTQVPWKRGSKYIKVRARELNALPTTTPR